jgi:hypothetical protein
MTRSYALLKLLEHGPLSTREIEEITGWTKGRCKEQSATFQKMVGSSAKAKRGQSGNSLLRIMRSAPLCH